MKSTELSAALDIEARRVYPRWVHEMKPWNGGSRHERAENFKAAWGLAVIEAARNLALSTRSEEFKAYYLDMSKIPDEGLSTGRSDSSLAA